MPNTSLEFLMALLIPFSNLSLKSFWKASSLALMDLTRSPIFPLTYEFLIAASLKVNLGTAPTAFLSSSKI